MVTIDIGLMYLTDRSTTITTIKIAEQSGAVLKFDGEVLEVFPGQGRRFHISLIKVMTLVPDRRGNHKLHIETIIDNLDIAVDEGCVSATNRLIAEVQQAMAAFRFDD